MEGKVRILVGQGRELSRLGWFKYHLGIELNLVTESCYPSIW